MRDGGRRPLEKLHVQRRRSPLAPERGSTLPIRVPQTPDFQDATGSHDGAGATIAHAKTLWLDCLIPFPRQPDAERVIAYVASLARAIIDKERAIRDSSDAIIAGIQAELEANQKLTPFAFDHPNLRDLRALGRLDAGIYDREYKSKIWLVENYRPGCATPDEEGFTVTPGPSLEIKLLRTRIDSETPKPGFYALILPTNISVYGTMNAVPYIGTAKDLPLLRKGDIVFGEAGFHKGRSIVLLDDVGRCTTNAHGLYARRADGDAQKTVFFRCIFHWYRAVGLIDLMAVGGSGGHFSPEYFHYLRIPKFPQAKRDAISKLYHHPAARPAERPTLNNFVDWHSRWNGDLGIHELDKEMNSLEGTLSDVQAQIIAGQPVRLPF